MALVFGSGLWLGVGFGSPASPGWGLGRVCLGTGCGVVPLLPAGVCGVCGWAWVSACTPPFVVRVMGRAWLSARSACSPPFPVPVCGVGVRAGVWVSAAPRHSLGRCWGVFVLVCPPAWSPAPLGWGCCAGVCGWRRAPPLLAGASGCVCVCECALLVPRLFWLGCAVWACLLGSGLGCAPPFLVGLLGCVFFGGGGWCVSALWCRLLAVLVPGLAVSVPPSPLFRAALLAPFFPFSSVVCVRAFSLFPVGRCSWVGVAGFGWVVLLCPFGGSCLRCLLGGGVWPPLAVLVSGLVAVGPSRSPPPPVFFRGGSACSSLCLPLAGARTGLHSVWSSGLLLVVAFCLAVSWRHWSGGLCTRWARRPFLLG